MGILTKITNSLFKENIQNAVNNQIEVIQNNTNLFQTQLDAFTGYSLYNDYYDAFQQTEKLVNKNTSMRLLSLNWTYLARLYKDLGLFARIVEEPVKKAFKNDPIVKSIFFNNDKESLLKTQKFFNKKIKPAFQQGCFIARIYGGAILVKDDGRDFNLPFDSNQDYFDLLPFNIWTLSNQYDEEQAGDYNKISHFKNTPNSFSFNGKTIHPSRIIKVKGLQKDYWNLYTKGWGVSIFESTKRSLFLMINYENCLAEMITEAKTSVLKIADFRNLAIQTSARGMNALNSKLDQMTRTKNSKDSIVLDKEDDFQNQQLSFTGLKEVQEVFLDTLCMEFGTSKRMLIGEGASGFSSGADTQEADDGYILSIRNDFTEFYEECYKVACLKTIGEVPQDLDIEFDNPRLLNPTEENAKRDSIINGINTLLEKGLIKTEEARQKLIAEKIINPVNEGDYN